MSSPVNFIVDTGSGVSLIKVGCLRDDVVCTTLNLIHLQGINEILIPTIGRCTLEINFRNTLINHEFHIVKNDFPISSQGILGVDFLSENNMSINYHNNQCFLYQKKDYFKRRLTIPPRSESIIPVHVINDCPFGILSKIEITPNIYTSETLISQDNPVVSVLNTSEESVDIDIPEMYLEPFIESKGVQLLHIQPNGNRNDNLKKKLRIDHLNSQEKEEILRICYNFADLFYLEGDKFSATTSIQHKIPVTNNKPVYVKPYRLPECHKEEINRQVIDMENQGIVKKSNSPWNAPLLVVPKKIDASGLKKWRVVVDFRKLNDVTVGDAYPLPNITDILDQLGNSKYFTTLDLASGFHQVPIDPNDSQKTAFSTMFGHYEYLRMPFGLKGAPATFQRLMNSVLTGLQGIKCFVYIDDVVIYGNSLEDHNSKLIDVFKRLRQNNLKLHPDKCEFMRKEVQYLGHVIGEDGIKPDPKKISAVSNYPVPTCQKDIKSFLGLAGYYRKFIKNFSDIIFPISKLLKKEQEFIWTDQQQNSFEILKSKLTSAPILQYPDFSKRFILTTDASGSAIGAILSQGVIGEDLPIAYASRALNKAEMNYATIEKELLAIVWGIQHFRPYLYGREFTIYTDHKPLKWLESNRDLGSRLTRWRIKLSDYNYTIEYKKGKSNTNADALSRNPVTSQVLSINHEMSYSQFIDHSKTHLIYNPNIVENISTSCKITVKFVISKFEDILYNNDVIHINPELIHIPITSFISPNYETLFDSLVLLKEFLISKNISEIKLIQNDELDWKSIRLMLRYIFKSTKIQIFIIKEKLIPNPEDIPNILSEYHSSPTGGHTGIKRTTKKIKAKFEWTNMSKDIKQFVKNCKSCQLNKLTRKKTKVPMEITTTSNKPFEKIFMDIVGPLTMTENGNKYILTIQDDLSKYSLAIPIETTDAKTVCEKFVEYFISKFGMPQCILTDQGTNFTSEIFHNLCKLFKIKKINSTAYHPQTNGALERSHQTFKDYLKHFINPNQTDWDKWIHLSTFSFNTTHHTSNNFTPHELIFGNEAKIPSSLKLDPKFSYSFDDYINDLKTRLQSSWKIAKENLIHSKETSKSYYDNKLISPKFKVGDEVLLLNERSTKGLNKKLCPSYRGPFEIISLDNVNVTVKIRNKLVKVHINKLKPFHHSNTSSN